MIKAVILTMSDKGSKGLRTDESAPVIKEFLATLKADVLHSEIIPDDKDLIKEKLLKYSEMADLILTNGGTGLSPRDITPEATKEVIEREVPGIPECMRAYGLLKTKRAMLSRGIAGVKGRCLIINLPGSPKAVRESLESIMEVLPHAVETVRGHGGECAR